jgi:hypothetical protein
MMVKRKQHTTKPTTRFLRDETFGGMKAGVVVFMSFSQRQKEEPNAAHPIDKITKFDRT